MMIMASKLCNARRGQIGMRPLALCDLTCGLVNEGEGFKESRLLCMGMQVSNQGGYSDDLLF
jgi:hypothetical protein